MNALPAELPMCTAETVRARTITSYKSYITQAAVSIHTHPIALAAAFDDAHACTRTRSTTHTRAYTQTYTHNAVLRSPPTTTTTTPPQMTTTTTHALARFPPPHFMTTSGTVGARLGKRRGCCRRRRPNVAR